MSGSITGIGRQIVIGYCIIHNSGHHILNPVKICCGVPLFNLLILPFSDIFGRDGVDRLVFEVRKYSILENVLLSFNAALALSVAHILNVNVVKRLKAYVRCPLLPFQEGAFPLFGVTLELEAPFLFLLFGTCPVSVIELAVPGLCLFIIISWYTSSSFHSGRAWCEMIRKLTNGWS